MKRSMLLTALLAQLALSVTAQAHVTVDPQQAPTGSYAKLTFRVPHGCDGSATTKITVHVADGVLSVKPQVHPGWKISTKTEKLKTPATLHGNPVTERVSEVTWTGGPLPDEYMDEFGMSVKLPELDAKTTLVFAVDQRCKKGSMEWKPELVLLGKVQ